ncbi:MAG: thioredoxin-disulfide reductase [Firmicutes bacterium]|nr:thioredoxin-disulfide reductase [Bacillota bacterium]MCM1401552.1 thioredoxin-disulfide reductase [Bacteroides sp.]MCM1476598.1 thioredoxin-disulfide reductase [Bacteroides sp.]
METNEISTKCLIIGSGPAGYTAALYTSRANLSPLVIEGPQPGGQLTITTEVENFPGYPEGTTGVGMMDDLRRQAVKFGADIRTGRVTSVDFSQRPFKAVTDSNLTITADTIIISTGASAKFLELEDEKRLMGMGVSACATCDGFFYRGKRVAVVGGGDTACEEALYLSNIAADVFLIVRKNYLRASKVMQQRVLEKPNIKVLFNTNTTGLYGEEFLEGAHLVENKGTDMEQKFDLALDGFFLAIGHKPNTEVFTPAIKVNEAGYIVTNSPYTTTNIPGVFAAGDVADPHYRQAITAAASGCKAALDVERFLNEQL